MGKGICQGRRGNGEESGGRADSVIEWLRLHRHEEVMNDEVRLMHPGSSHHFAWYDIFPPPPEEMFTVISLGEFLCNLLPPQVEVISCAYFSFADTSVNSLNRDRDRLLFSCSVMLFYTMLTLGRRLNNIEARPLLALAGILAVGMGVGAGSGVSYFLGVDHTPMHVAAFFLALGGYWRCACCCIGCHSRCRHSNIHAFSLCDNNLES